MEGGGRGGDNDLGEFFEGFLVELEIFEDGLLGFVSDAELGEVGEGRKVGDFAVFQEAGAEGLVIGGGAANDGGVIGLIGLDKDFGGVKVAAADATDDLGEELESMFLGGKIREAEAGVGLSDADGREQGKIKALGDGLGANNNIVVAVFNPFIESIEAFGFFVVGVKAGDAGGGEEFS